MVVEAGLADGRDTRAFRQLAQRGDDVVRSILGTGWMNADDGKNIRIFFRQLDRAPAAGERGADGEDAFDAGFVRPREDFIEVVGEIRVVEMGVGINEHLLFRAKGFQELRITRVVAETIEIRIVLHPVYQLWTAGKYRPVE